MAFPTTNLYARYEAKDEAYSDNDPVTTTTDQSGNGRDLTGTNDPTYKTNILNGHAVYRYDETNSEKHSVGITVTGTEAFTIAVVCARSAAGTVRDWVMSLSDGSTTRIFGITESDETAGEWGSFVKTSIQTVKPGPTSGADTTDFTTLVLIFEGGSVNEATLRRDGSLVETLAVGGNLDFDTLTLGDNGLQGQYFDGDIALAAAWDKVLDSTELTDLQDYIDSTYFGSGATTESISGTSAGTSTDTAAATVNVTGTATSAGTSTDTGAITATASISGTSAGTSADTGAATSATRITGTSAGTSTDTGAVTTSSQGAAAGTSAGTSTDTAAATATASISGTSAGLSADSVAAIATAALGGTSPGSSVDTSTAKLMQALTGDSAGTSSDSGTATAFGAEVDLQPPFKARFTQPVHKAIWLRSD